MAAKKKQAEQAPDGGKPAVKRSSSKKGASKSSSAQSSATKSTTEVARERAMALAKQRAQRAQAKARRDRPAVSEEPLAPGELAEFRVLLVAMRKRLTEQVAALRNESLTRDDEVNAEEDGTDAFERLFSLERAGSEQDVIFEIDEAIRRMEGGAYGGCDSCDKVIERARLKAVPFVKNCIDCQSIAEGDRSNYAAIRARFQ